VGEPHWIGGIDMPNGHVTWDDGTEGNLKWNGSDGLPWHHDSGQPNDCDGPGTEPCMFMGPHARWFDFACAPKTKFINSKGVEETPTQGPEVPITTEYMGIT